MVLGKFVWVKGSARRKQSMFSSYCKILPLIQLTRLGTLRNYTKLEDFSGPMVENTLWWRMVGALCKSKILLVVVTYISE